MKWTWTCTFQPEISRLRKERGRRQRTRLRVEKVGIPDISAALKHYLCNIPSLPKQRDRSTWLPSLVRRLRDLQWPVWDHQGRSLPRRPLWQPRAKQVRPALMLEVSRPALSLCRAVSRSCSRSKAIKPSTRTVKRDKADDVQPRDPRPARRPNRASRKSRRPRRAAPAVLGAEAEA